MSSPSRMIRSSRSISAASVERIASIMVWTGMSGLPLGRPGDLPPLLRYPGRRAGVHVVEDLVGRLGRVRLRRGDGLTELGADLLAHGFLVGLRQHTAGRQVRADTDQRVE